MTGANDWPLRAEQQAIVQDYAGGRVGIAAVPGSGKTYTLAHLAAHLIAHQPLQREQEVLIVTFTNSAVNSFQARLAHLLQDKYHLLSYVGYRVRTLHGLAHDIVRERPALVGLADDFVIMDEREALEIQRDSVLQQLSSWWDRLQSYLDSEIEPKRARYQVERYFPGLVARFIKHAKDRRCDPEALRVALQDAGEGFELARFAVEVYADYQRGLAYRGAVDFDDLVRLALQALEMDQQYLARLRDRWPFILEDEAQDSSHLQEQMLSLLSDNRNWVRVGDPNQAINTTFTTADPRFLLEFLDQPGVTERPLSVSGRSAEPIIHLANELVRWTVEEHPIPELSAPFDYVTAPRRGVWRVLPRPPVSGDPQPNPPQGAIHLYYRPGQKITPEKELEIVVSAEEFSLLEWLAEIEDLPPDERPTVAVLVPENSRGFKLAQLLRRHDVPFEELLRSSTATREAVNLLRVLLEYLSQPDDLKALKQLFWSLMAEDRRERVLGDVELRQTITDVFARYRHIEDFLWPTTPDALADLENIAADYEWLPGDLRLFREQVRRWLYATSLPVDQLVLTIAQDIFSEPVDVALAHKVAVVLRGLARTHPDWRLAEFVEELRAIGSNQRRFIGFDDAEAGYEPKPGVITVATMHAAKGLEWDRVYLMAVSNYGFPSALPYDSFIGERWFVRSSYDHTVAYLNLEAEMLAQLDALLDGVPDEYVEGQPTLSARLDYARERLRLLYVGVTRARRELIITWNMGRFWQKGPGYENQPAQPLLMLAGFWDEEN